MGAAKNGIKDEVMSSDDEVPLASRKRKKLTAKDEPVSDEGEQSPVTNGGGEDDGDSDYKEDDSEDDVPLSKRKVGEC